MTFKYLKNALMLYLLLLVLLVPLSIQRAHSQTGDVYFDIVVDDMRQKIYGANSESGAVDIISMTSLEVISSINVGGEPKGMDMNSSGTELAVTLYTGGEIAFIDLDTLTVIDRVTPQNASPNRPNDVLYGRAGRLYSVGNGGSSEDHIHIFDSSTKTEISTSTEYIRGNPRIAISGDHNRLIVSEHFSPNKLYRFDISTEPITRTHSSPHGPVSSSVIAISPDGEHVYTSFGQIWSGDLSTQLGNFDTSIPCENFCTLLDTDIGYTHAKGRVFISFIIGGSSSYLFEFDGETFQRLRTYRFDYPIKAPRSNQNGTKVYVSTAEGIQVFPADLDAAVFLPVAYYNYCAGLIDDFSNPGTGWTVVDNENVRTEYVNNEYRILSKRAGTLFLFRVPVGCALNNYTVATDIRWHANTGNSYGVLFGIEGNFERFYLFEINTDFNLYRVLYYNGDSFVQLVSPSTGYSINGGTAVNNLRVEVQDSEATLYINDIFVHHLINLAGLSSLTSVGILSSSYSDSPTSDARFDNFRFTLPEAASINLRSLSGRELPKSHAPNNLSFHKTLTWDEIFENRENEP